MQPKDYLADVLEMEKNMVVNYSYALNEASCEALYKEYKKQFDDLSTFTKKLFNFAYSNGWYNLEEEDLSKIKQEITQLTTSLQALNTNE